MWLLVFLLSPLTYIHYHTKKKYIHRPQRILVIRERALWSTLLTFPMIKQLQDHYGNECSYHCLCTKRNMGVMNNRWYFSHYINLFSLSWIIELIKKWKYYDIVIDTEDYFRHTALISLRTGKVSSWFGEIVSKRLWYTFPVPYNDQQHCAVSFIDLLTPFVSDRSVPKSLEPLTYTDTHKQKVDTYIQTLPTTNIICLHTAGAETWSSRFRSSTNRMSLIQKIQTDYNTTDTNVAIFLSWTASEQINIDTIIEWLDDTTNIISGVNLFNLPEFAYFLSQCACMISNDTWPMHLAAAMGTTTIGLFGPNLPVRFGPYPADKHIALYKGNGIPTINVHHGSFKEDKHKRVDHITVWDVFNSLTTILSQK